MTQSSGKNRKVNKKIINISLIILLIITMVLITGCESNKNEIKTEENTPVTENVTNEEKEKVKVKGIEVEDNLLKYGTYEGIDLAKGSKITLNEDGTFLYEDNETSGEGTYEVKNQEIDDIEGSYNAWVIEFNSLENASSGKIPGDFYWLFTENRRHFTRRSFN